MTIFGRTTVRWLSLGSIAALLGAPCPVLASESAQFLRELHYDLKSIAPLASPLDTGELVSSIYARTLSEGTSPSQLAASHLLIEALAQPQAFPQVQLSVLRDRAPEHEALGQESVASLGDWAREFEAKPAAHQSYLAAIEPLRRAFLANGSVPKDPDGLRPLLEAIFAGGARYRLDAIKPRVVIPDDAAPMDQQELQNAFKLELNLQEQIFFESVKEKLQQSQEGRRVLRGALAEYGRIGRKIAVESRDYPDSKIILEDGIERVDGIAAEAAYTLDQERDIDQGTFLFNRKFLEFKDSETALEQAAAAMAHEMRHLWLAARIKRVMPEYLDVFSRDAADEQWARLKQLLVAWEIHGRPNLDVRASQNLVADPGKYWNEMRLSDSRYIADLDISDMRDPIGAYSSRLEALSVSLAMAVDPSVRQVLVGLITPIVREVEYLLTAEGRGLMAKMRAAAADPRYRELSDGVKHDLGKLAHYVRAGQHPADPASYHTISNESFFPILLAPRF